MAVVTVPPSAGAAREAERRQQPFLIVLAGRPWVRCLRTWLRDTWWEFRGPWMARPAVPEAPRDRKSVV